MNSKILSVAIGAGLLATALSGCSLLYPHWGATTFPTDSPSTSASASPTPTATASPTPTATLPTIKTASVQIMTATVDATGGVLDVVAQVGNVAEDGGTCQLNVISAGTSKSVLVKAERNVTTTQCFPMEVTLAGLLPGNAIITVTYHSADYQGVSAGQGVVVP
jgi:hypothetical protein